MIVVIEGYDSFKETDKTVDCPYLEYSANYYFWMGGYKLAATGQKKPRSWSGGLDNQRKAATANKTHGMCESPAYRSWAGIIQRCTNPKCKAWESYGGRGITVCERWLKFENFFADMGPRAPDLSIERIDVNGNYEPGNCKWATKKEQYNNKRNTRLLTHQGETATMSEWARRCGLEPTTLLTRMERGWSVERALTKESTDIRNCKNKSGFPGVYKYAFGDKWAAQLKINGRLVALGRGDTPLEAYMLRLSAAKENGITLPEGNDFLDRKNQNRGEAMQLSSMQLPMDFDHGVQ